MDKMHAAVTHALAKVVVAATGEKVLIGGHTIRTMTSEHPCGNNCG